MDGNSTSRASKRLAAIVAVLTFCAGFVSAQQSHDAGVWTNEPAGAAVVLDCSFSSTPSACGILDVYSSAVRDSDGSAPVSPSGVVRSTIYPGNQSGGAQLNWTASQVSNEMYVGKMWRTNSAFEGRTTANKTFFVRGPGVNGFFGLGGSPGSTSWPRGRDVRRAS